MTKKVVLAYSGGLDTSVIIQWLMENHGMEVHCLAGDVGQGAEELEGLEEKAAASGAASCKIADLRHAFVDEVIWPSLRAFAVYEQRYLLGTSMARPILSRAQVEYAREVGASAVCHGCTGKGNDQVRFELGYQALAPDLEIIAPWRTWEITSREDALDYAEKHGIQVTASRTKIYSRDKNLWHISHEGGAIEDPMNPPPADAWTMTVDPKAAPDESIHVAITYEQGVPVAIDGRAMDGVSMIEHLNEVAGAHGVGRVDLIENRLVGMKSRGLYETPAGTVILEGLKTLRSVTLERDTYRQCERLAIEYADMVYTGRWFHPLRRALDAFFLSANEHVTGTVSVELYKGTATARTVDAPFSLYSEDLATFGASAKYDQADSKGFVKLYGLPGAVAAERDRDAASAGANS